MAWHSFRAPVRGATLALVAMVFAVAISGCTAPAGGPQGARPANITPPPVPMPAPPVTEVQPPPPAAPGPVGPSPEAVATEGRAKVALLPPLSGANRSIGQAMLDAGNMALFDVSAEIALLPRDTGSSPDNARAAAEKAISDHVGLILGPVFASSVAPVRSLAEPDGINVIAFSTDASVAGGNVFVVGFLPVQQVDRIIGFARSRGMTKLAALVPDNPYGLTVSTEIGIVRDHLAMPPPRILTIDNNPKAQIESLAADPPDMLLIAVGGDQLRALGDALGAFKAAHPAVQFLGTGLWDDPSLGQIPALVGGWYVAAPPGGFASFASRFQQTYNYQPPRIASLAYDAVALAAAIAKGAPGNLNPFTRDVLLQPNGFLGMDGAFRFLPSGLSERNLAVLAIGPNGPAVIDPPPPTFEKLTE